MCNTWRKGQNTIRVKKGIKNIIIVVVVVIVVCFVAIFIKKQQKYASKGNQKNLLPFVIVFFVMLSHIVAVDYMLE